MRRERALPAPTPALVPLAQPDSPEERELAGGLAIDGAIFSTAGLHTDCVRDASEARVHLGDVVIPGVSRVGVETLILGDELREIRSGGLAERLARAAPGGQHGRLPER